MLCFLEFLKTSCKKSSKHAWTEVELDEAAAAVGIKLNQRQLTLEELPSLTDERRWEFLEELLELTYIELSLLCSIRKFDGKLFCISLVALMPQS
jgi:hypothetical protein